jgi:hypothetical protein
MLCYKGGIECRKHTSSKHMEHRDDQGKGTYARKGHSGKILQGLKVSRRRGKVLKGLHIRHASDGSVESNMELALGQRLVYANAINKTHNGNVPRCKFNEPKEGKLGGFSYLESLKKCKRRLCWGTFFEGSLVGLKNGKTSIDKTSIQNHFNECDKDKITRPFFHF